MKKDEATTHDAAARTDESAAQDELAALTRQVEDLKNQLLRAQADFQNYKKRLEKEQAAFVEFANARVLLEILPVVDNLERAAAHVPDELRENEWAKGVLQVAKHVQATLAALGVERVGTVGEAYDPERHEAVARSGDKAVAVTAVYEPGYLFRGKTLRPAKVQVGPGAAQPVPDPVPEPPEPVTPPDLPPPPATD